MIKVLVVDDSSFFRRRITGMLGADPSIEVIGQACDGMEAVEKARQLDPDVITMDIEMPKMDGITAVKQIMQRKATPILMFSSLTHQGAKSTFDALNAGASDFLPKSFEDIATEREEVAEKLRERVRLLGLKKLPGTIKPVISPSLSVATRKGRLAKADFQLMVIGASTGGPVAIEKILTQLPGDFHTPILLIQHMPSTFTGAFAERLNKICRIKVKEAESGDQLEPGTAYIAPGGKQMKMKANGRATLLQIEESSGNITYKPSVDVTFQSVAANYRGKVLAIVLTGMGADGRDGAKQLKQNGAIVWAQEESSCVVYGMPMAVVNANIADQVLSVDEIGSTLSHI